MILRTSLLAVPYLWHMVSFKARFRAVDVKYVIAVLAYSLESHTLRHAAPSLGRTTSILCVSHPSTSLSLPPSFSFSLVPSHYFSSPLSSIPIQLRDVRRELQDVLHERDVAVARGGRVNDLKETVSELRRHNKELENQVGHLPLYDTAI